MGKKRKSEGCAVDMTPMIDVVFQMIIFFIVTLQMTEAKDKDVVLEYGPNGEVIKEGSTERAASVLIIDVGPRGRVSVLNQQIEMRQLDTMVRNRLRAQGDSFQIWIRGHYEVPHSHIKNVMDVCSNAGVGRVHIIAIKEARTESSRQHVRDRQSYNQSRNNAQRR